MLIGTKRRYLLGIVCQCVLAAGWMHSEIVSAAQPYPQKPVTLVIPYGQGSDSDFQARLMITAIKKHLPAVEIIGENRAGESGTMAAIAVKNAPADGYTLLLGRSGTHVVAPALQPSLAYRWTDFTFLGVLSLEPLICAVRSDSPFKTPQAMLQAMRKAPGKFRYGHAGPGTIHNVITQYLFKLNGLKSDVAIGVSYKGANEETAALLAGEIDFLCNNLGTMIEPIRTGKIVPFFTTAPGRLSLLPNVRNASEVGYPDLRNLIGWSVLAGPAGMPAPIVAQWQKALKGLATDPEWIAGLEQRNSIQTLGTAKDNEQFIKQQFKFYEHLVPTLGLHQ